jgi:guanine deaminase
MSTTVTAEQFLARSIRLATANVLNSGGPFGAVIVTADGRAFDGVNRVTATTIPPHTQKSRPSARPAANWAPSTSAAPLYTSCEPCPMCLASALWARVDRVVFAADRHDAASVGFDDAVFYEYFDNQDRDALMPVSKLELGDPEAPAPWNRSTPGTRSNPGLTTRARWLT